MPDVYYKFDIIRQCNNYVISFNPRNNPIYNIKMMLIIATYLRDVPCALKSQFINSNIPLRLGGDKSLYFCFIVGNQNYII